MDFKLERDMHSFFKARKLGLDVSPAAANTAIPVFYAEGLEVRADGTGAGAGGRGSSENGGGVVEMRAFGFESNGTEGTACGGEVGVACFGRRHHGRMVSRIG